MQTAGSFITKFNFREHIYIYMIQLNNLLVGDI